MSCSKQPADGQSDSNDFDPLQVFEVSHQKCLVLHIKVVCGRNITKGTFSNFIDYPDPYVQLEIKNIPERRRWTKCISNNSAPLWNEEFTFSLDFDKKNVLDIYLMEGNYGPDQELASTSLDLSNIPMNKQVRHTFNFERDNFKYGEVDCEFIIEHCHPELRFSMSLCEEEKRFRDQRLKRVFESLKELLGNDEDAPTCLEEVPVIAVMGSGGGFRALTGFSGAMVALEETKVLDCATYVASLSGSTWFTSTLYSHPKWPQVPMEEVRKEIRECISQSLVRFLFNKLRDLMSHVLGKRQHGQPVSFTDFFGLMVGDTLLPQRIDSKLTEQQPKIKDGRCPMPLYSCVHAKRRVSARRFQEWVEFSPYELGMPKYGCFLRAQNYGNKYFQGRIVRRFDEPPLHFLQGTWGSAYSSLFKRLTTNLDPLAVDPDEVDSQQSHFDTQYESENSSDEENEEKKMEETKEESKNIERTSNVKTTKQPFWTSIITRLMKGENILNDRSWRAGVIHNFMRGLKVKRLASSSTTEEPAKEDEGSLGDVDNEDCDDDEFEDFVDEKDEFDGLYDLGPQVLQKHMYMVDAGLTFNSPYPLVLRQQRGIDLILSFDFSARPSDSHPPFKQIKLANKWAYMQHVTFPKIDTEEHEKNGVQEVYVFQDPEDPRAPLIMHFVLVNESFKRFKKPGVERVTAEEKEFADFSIFDNPQKPYSTFNFTYDPKNFNRLSELTEYNTRNNVEKIKACIKECVRRRRRNILGLGSDSASRPGPQDRSQ